MLLNWLETHQPVAEDLVMTHGDFCLPNILTDGERITGYIDMGKSGPADRWQDIALCYRSIRDNLSGAYGGEVINPCFKPEQLTEKLGIPLDKDKLRYYLLLDELF